MPSREEIIFMLEKRLARLEALAGITPDPATVINPRLNRGAKKLQKTEVQDDRNLSPA